MASTIAEVNQLSEQGWTVVSFAMPPAGGENEYLMKRANLEPKFLSVAVPLVSNVQQQLWGRHDADTTQLQFERRSQ